MGLVPRVVLLGLRANTLLTPPGGIMEGSVGFSLVETGEQVH